MRMPVVLWLALLALPVLVACGSGSGGEEKTKVDDEAYLKIMCTGLTNFSDALMTKTKAEEIAQVIKDFIAELQKVEPSSDVVTFHQEFVKYLEDSVSDPTSLVTRKPPVPPDDVRSRLSARESSVPECKNPTFFDVQQ